ncbi:MAG: PfkB family carbohydrate kinase [Candidatus Nanopelagicales bacterium]
MSSPRVAVFGSHPILTITVETRATGDSDDIHVHAGGQGVWVARMAGEIGAEPVLCGTAGGETGAVVAGLLADLPFESRLVRVSAPSGCYVIDRRSGERRPFATAWSLPLTRHELDDLFSTTVSAAIAADVLVVTNPLPGDALPGEFYRNLVADVRSMGTPVLVDLSPPRLDAALRGGPDLVKLNDWELAQFVTGPVDSEPDRRAAVTRLHDQGARSVIVTRGGLPAYATAEDGTTYEFTPPRFDHGSPEGCGDSMMGGMATGWARGLPWQDVITLGMAAGAANFLRHGLGTGVRAMVEQLTPQIRCRVVPDPASAPTSEG